LALNDYLATHPKLIKNWIDFYTIKSKIWVCQTLSDIFSLIALLNWQQSTTIDGITKRWYAHQVSKVNNYFYDPTYGLIIKSLSYFGMTEKELGRYLKIR
jgi:ABC-type long-subunit fatty acid transport system fused permease/ATPase subunit